MFSTNYTKRKIYLPPPVKKGKLSLEEVLDIRSSVRKYSPQPLTLEEVSTILWAGYGKNKYRLTSPSAGALYPVFIYSFVGNVDNLDKGIYLYDYHHHCLFLITDKDKRASLAEAALNQDYIKKAPFVLVICVRFEVTTSRYGKRGIPYVYIEVGHIGQNIYLEAVSLGLGTVAVGAFYNEEVKKLLEENVEPVYIMPVGRI